MSNRAGLIVVLVALAIVGYRFWTASNSSSSVASVSEQEFQQQLSEPGLLLAKFGAEWCGPCQRIDGELQHLASSQAGNLRIVVVDVDHEPGLAETYGVRGIPHLILFQDSQQLDVRRGFMSHDDLSAWVDATRNTAGEAIDGQQVSYQRSRFQGL
jgi:thioredoxin-like negative regulator of GroEL